VRLETEQMDRTQPTDLATEPGRPARSLPKLSRERIVAAAAELLDRDGLAEFSMRRLARHLEVGTMTLYSYYRGRKELLDAVVDHGAAALELPAMEGPWRERIAALMHVLREALLAHRSVVSLRMDQPLITPSALRFADAALAVLRDAGFNPGDAALAYRTLFTFTFGSVAFASDEAADMARRRIEEVLALAGDYTAVRESMSEFARMNSEELFEFGLQRLLDGLENELAASTRPSPQAPGEPAGAPPR